VSGSSGSTLPKGLRCGKPAPVVVSPSSLNRKLATVLVAPLTAARHAYPSRAACAFAGKPGEVALDQMRCVDKSRLIRHVGELQAEAAREVLRVLREMFAE